jgi:hypothetical protein
MRAVALPLVAALVLAAGCGSDDDETTSSARDVEQSLKTELAAGDSGVVDLGDPPKLVRCEKDANRKNGWRCTVTPTTGKNILCLVDVDKDGKPVKTVCGPVDN